MTKRSLFLACLCGLALVGAGCGDDDDNQALSYDDTGTEISEICQSVEDEAQGLNGKPKNDAPILENFVPAFEKAVEDIRALEVHEDLHDAHEGFVTSSEEQVGLAKEAQALAEQGNAKEYRAKVGEVESVGAAGETFASQLGATACLSDE